MRSYPRYKQSGVEWIGNIPEHWEETKIQYLLYVISGNGFPEDLQGRQEGRFPFFKVSDINFNGKSVSDAKNYVSEEDVLIRRWKVIPKQSILAPKIGEALRKNHRKINDIECLIDNNMMAIYSKQYKDFDISWLYYLFCIIDMQWFANPGTVPSVSIDKFKLSLIPYAPILEQNTIADYLDSHIPKIDSIIEKKQRLIGLLKEQRTAIINQAVTKGLNPEVEMKKSGVEWLGEIPEHWAIKQLKYCAIIRSGQVDPRIEKYRYMLLIAPNHIESKTGRLLYTETAEEQGAESGKYTFKNRDILYSKIRPHLQKACLARGEGLCSADIYAIKTTDEIIPEFFLHFILTDRFTSYTVERSMRVAMPKINRDDLTKSFIAFPEKEEQKQIAEYIQQEAAMIDGMVSRIEREIDLIQEYRTALISEVVTGKIDVRLEAES